MSDNLYSNLGQRVNKVNPQILKNKREFTLSDFEHSGISEDDIENVISALCNDLKHLLEMDDFDQLVHDLFKIENTLYHLEEDHSHLADRLPSLKTFFQHLSPIFLRVLIDEQKSKNNGEPLLKGFLEALRVAIEEEIYIWQEKIIECE